jgi:release factor glutamine methyltransferase
VAEGDLFEPLEHTIDRQPFNLILANPPYVPTGQIPQLDRNVRDFEPVTALDGGLDGLSIHRRILEQAPARLLPGGHIFIEIAYDQGEVAIQLAGEHPQFIEAKILKDHAGNDRVLTARLG